MTRDELLEAYAEGKRDFGGANLGGTPLGEESLAIVAHLVDLARIRGLK